MFINKRNDNNQFICERIIQTKKFLDFVTKNSNFRETEAINIFFDSNLDSENYQNKIKFIKIPSEETILQRYFEECSEYNKELSEFEKQKFRDVFEKIQLNIEFFKVI